MMLGFLLARAGLPVVVLEKHADFLRDFRGDTIHPSTLELMHELGLLEEFLVRPHNDVLELSAQVGEARVVIADFRHLPTRCKFLAVMPQWEFLNFLAERARRYSTFDLRMRTAATGLIEEGGRVTGVRARGPEGELEIRADLVVSADGRHSTLRPLAGLPGRAFGAPMDVLWMSLPRRADDADETFGHIENGRMLVMINRGDYWQCAFVIPKGGFEELKAAGLDAFRRELVSLTPALADRVEGLRAWDDVKLLTVAVDRLERWCRPGLLCIGDSAHAMSPIGGVGVNLAIQDAVASANLLAARLASGAPSLEDLERVQRRREWPTRMTQRMQIFIQDRVVGRALQKGSGRMGLPVPLRLLRRFAFLRRIPARLVGMGFRPEHVHTPEAASALRR
jgi:2-polyprenyl-6-methoxyphenol hydroxylase-like FAD-dependent oxidoreductase